MANLSELNQWDAGVYRLELTDPAEGGESGKANAPLKNLANRTVYLKAKVDGLEAGTLLPAASETAAGKVELATVAEVQTGTDPGRAVTPAGLAARTATETRAGVVELATTAEATTGTDAERAVTPAGLAAALAAKSIPVVYNGKTSGQLYTGAALMTFAHGLGAAPAFWDAFVECVETDLGWTAGDVAKAPFAEGTGNYSLAVWADATNIYVRTSVHGLMLLSKDGAVGSLCSTANKWKIFVRASTG